MGGGQSSDTAQNVEKYIADIKWIHSTAVEELGYDIPIDAIPGILRSANNDPPLAVLALVEGRGSRALEECRACGATFTANEKRENKDKRTTETTAPVTTPTDPAPVSSSLTGSDTSSESAVTATAPTNALSTAFKSIRLALNEREKELKQLNATHFDTSAILKDVAALGGPTKVVANGKKTSAPRRTTSPPPEETNTVVDTGGVPHISSDLSADKSVARRRFFEKKIFQEKIAKVREVVDNVSNDDIIMVLHSLDLDVNKTISAFLEDGGSSILGGWSTSSGVSVTAAKKKKNKNKKTTKTTAPVTAPSAPAPVEAAPVSSSVTESAMVVARVKDTMLRIGLLIPEEDILKALHSFDYNIGMTWLALVKDPRATLVIGEWNTTPTSPAIAALEKSTKAVTNGKAAPVPKTASPPPAAGPIKHATSQSSITSSVGADSDVNHSPTHKEKKKTAPKTVVNSGGVQLTSSGLSADQLAVLEQNHHLTMAARGVDASLIASSENVPRKRTNINKNNKWRDAK